MANMIETKVFETGERYFQSFNDLCIFLKNWYRLFNLSKKFGKIVGFDFLMED